MTGGAVVVLGPSGRNTAAGMTGGVLFLYDEDTRIKGLLSESAPTPHRLDAADSNQLRILVREHVGMTGSTVGSTLLEDWDTAVRRFWVLRPEPPEPRTSEAETPEEESSDPIEQDVVLTLGS
jgi:glutamate synthase domain-containing protein 3